MTNNFCFSTNVQALLNQEWIVATQDQPSVSLSILA
jgi:hypothetical protein